MFWIKKKGAAVTEYGLAAGLIGVLVIGAVQLSGNKLDELFGVAANNIEEVTLSEAETQCSDPVFGTISHRGRVTAFLEEIVPYGESCVSEQRFCQKGEFLGSYQFSSCQIAEKPGRFEFTNCGQTGPSGPSQTQCDAVYAGTSLEGITVTSGYQSFTVPASGQWRFEIRGAAGGYGQSSSYRGGYGAFLSGTITLTARDTLKILIGQRGNNHGNAGGGGGGATFLATSGNVPLLTAAGGGGGADTDKGGHGLATVVDETNNGAGQGSNPSYAGAGFAGSSSSAQSFTSGGLGAASVGGFGGGGRGVNDADGIHEDRGGGGGGYLGGNGNYLTAGSGGYSFITGAVNYGAALTSSASGNNADHGRLILEYME